MSNNLSGTKNDQVSNDQVNPVRRAFISDLVIDFENKIVSRGDQKIELPVLSYNILVTLIRFSPEIVNSQKLIELVWEGVLIGEENLKQRISMLRKSLNTAEGNQQYIKTVRGKGYQLACSVQFEAVCNRNWNFFSRLNLAFRNKRRMLASISSVFLLFPIGLMFFQKSLSSSPSNRILPTDKTSSVKKIELVKNSNWQTKLSVLIEPLSANKGFCFDGYDDYEDISYSQAFDIDTGDFSISAWLKTDRNTLTVIADKREENKEMNTKGYAFYLKHGNLALQLADREGTWYCYPTRGSCTNYETSAYVTDNQWHFVAVTVNRDEAEGIKFFVDGELVETADPRFRNLSLSNLSSLRIGARSSFESGLFEGVIGNVGLYNYVLSPANIQNSFQQGNRRQCN